MEEDWNRTISIALTHSSLVQPEIVNEWVEVWDAALDAGVKGTRIAQAVFRVMSRPVCGVFFNFPTMFTCVTAPRVCSRGHAFRHREGRPTITSELSHFAGIPANQSDCRSDPTPRTSKFLRLRPASNQT